MIINHNLKGLKILNNTKHHEKLSANSMEKLSTGSRINHAADEAAGLVISEKMRSQIRGLEQAKRNVQDGISLVNSAEGGLSGIQEQLQRARELAVQAASDTLTSEDRTAIQAEIDEIKNGIDHIANQTDFNGVHLLNGAKPVGYSSDPTDQPSYNYENALFLNVSPDGSFDLKINEGYPATLNDDNQVLIYGGGGNSRPALLIGNQSHDLKLNVSETTTEANGVFKTVSTIDNIEVTQTIRIVKDKYEFNYKIDNKGSEAQNLGFYFHMDMMLGNDDAAPFMVDDLPVIQEEAFSGSRLPESFSVYNNNGNPDLKAGGILKGTSIIEQPTELRIGQYNDVSNAAAWTDTNQPVGDSGYALLWSSRTVPAGRSFEVNTFYGLDVPPTIPDPTIGTEEGPYDIKVQVGANSGENFKVRLSDVRTHKLEIEDIVIDPFARAIEAIDKLDSAMQKVSFERSKYGAYQNRLEHTQSNVENSAVNVLAAESRIRDTDMAKEIMEQTKNSILLQTSHAMLAQSNQLPQAVLQLLK